ncbi:hypothetical protein CLU79DRAFT_738723 [Phycomyces nitens]|nr:hypothetical protein CLU79DRAFT_738723 [Phycomyces nitens]
MHWRALVLLITGFSVIYLISFAQDASYPQPLLISRFSIKNISPPLIDKNILFTTKDSLYYINLLYSREDNGSMKSTRSGHVEISKTKLVDIVPDKHETVKDGKANYNGPHGGEYKGWEQEAIQNLPGPISKVSVLETSNVEPDTPIFGVMYHVLYEEKIMHLVRVYYYSEQMPGNLLYKDLVLPGSVWPDTFSLEKDCILYSRDPDDYRFRIAPLPIDLFQSTQSIEMPIVLFSRPGSSIQGWYHPRKTVEHDVVLSRLYSPASNTFRVFSLDVHKTQRAFHINITVVDGTDDKWIKREHSNFTYPLYSEDSLEYMSFVDGTHFHQERVETGMPGLHIARSSDAKTIVAPYIKNSFLTLDFTDRADVIQHDEDERLFLYKDDQGNIIPEYFWWFAGELWPSDDVPDTTIVGAELNTNGTILALWTKSNTIHIYRRERDIGATFEASQNGGYGKMKEPHEQTTPSRWNHTMVITPTQAGYGSKGVSAVMLWDTSDEQMNYITVLVDDTAVYTYLLDKIGYEKKVGFISFLEEQWMTWLAMLAIIFVFMRNELNQV